MFQAIVRFAEDDMGATAIEYGLMVAMIAFVLIGTLNLIGCDLKVKLWQIDSALKNAS